MNIHLLFIALLIAFPLEPVQAERNTVNQLLQEYTTQGASTADAQQGKQLWQKTFAGNDEFPQRSCTVCHTKDLTLSGKHIKTNKTINPMAPSVNPNRLTNSKKIEKWFKRNCKWTLGRECTPQEKANLLVYIENHLNYQE